MATGRHLRCSPFYIANSDVMVKPLVRLGRKRRSNIYGRAQVPVGREYKSCCAVVEGCYRCLFFVPAPGTFSSPELPRLEAEAAANPGAKGALIRHLHVWLPLLRRSHCAQPLADRFATP